MAYSRHSLGSGAVDYRRDRPILHFATPTADVEHARRRDRLEATGFTIATTMKEATA